VHNIGDVEYETTHWLEKNRDPLQDDLQTCCKKSTISLVSALFSENLTGVGEVDDPHAKKRGKGVNFVTVASQYKVHTTILIYN
jgi:myosin heavy subunit